MSSLEYPRVSVAIANYNYASFVGDAIESVLAQAYPNLEVIVVDDASTDASIAVVEGIAQRDRRVTLLKNERNLGAAANCNKAIAQCSGDYIAMLGADNLMLPGHLGRAVEYYRSHPRCDLRSTGWLQMHDDARAPGGIRYLDAWRNVASYSARRKLEDIFCYGDVTLIETILFPRRLLERWGAFDEASSVNDVELQLRYANEGTLFAHDARPSIAFRYHAFGRGTPENYVASGNQLRGWISLVRTYLTPENAARLVGQRRRAGACFGGFAKALERDNAALHREMLAQPSSALADTMARIAAIPDKLPGSRVAGPRVSVIVPSVGRLGLLRETFDSIAAQTEPNWEIVVVQNDGGDLECAIDALPYRERIVYARTLATGNASGARNVALRLASGESIAYANEGDRWLPEHLQAVCAAMDDTQVDIVQSGARAVFCDVLIDRSAALFEPTYARERTDGSFFASPHAPFVDACRLYAPIASVAHRRYCTEIVGPFDEGLALREDYEFLMRLVGGGGFYVRRLTAPTVEAVYRKGLSMHVLGARPHALPGSLRYIYAKHGSQDAALGAWRERYVEEAAQAVMQARSAQTMDAFVAAMRVLNGASPGIDSRPR